MAEDIKDNGRIVISKKTQELIRNIHLEIVRLRDVRNKLLKVVYNESDKEGDYEPNREFTELILIEKKE